MRALLLTFALACKGTPTTTPDTEAHTNTDAESDTDAVPYRVVDAGYAWGTMDSGALDPALTATVVDSRVEVVHADHSISCCPQVEVVLTHVGNALNATYTLVGDCDCAVPIDLHYTIAGLPAGDWTLTADGEQVGFTLP